MNVLDFVLKIDKVIPDDVCDQFVNFFEACGMTEDYHNDGYPHWTELNISYHNPHLNKKVHTLSRIVHQRYREYIAPYGSYFSTGPDLVRYEPTNMKRYVENSDDRYDMHADVATLATAERFIAFVYYLNDDFEGAETVFYPQCTVTPKKGSVLVFPPYWVLPHQGNPVKKGKKYIMSTYALWDDGQD